MLLKHLHFDNFSKNEFVNFEFLKDEGLAKEEGHFIRKGRSLHSKRIQYLGIIQTFIKVKPVTGRIISVQN